MTNQPNQQPPSNNENPEHIPAGYYVPPVPPYQAPVPPHAFADPTAETRPTVPPYGQGQFAAPAAYGQQQNPATMAYRSGSGYVTGPKGLSLTSMILGLASLLVGFGFFMVPQIVGVILGHLGLRKESPHGRGFAITGLITSYLAVLIFGALYALFIVGIFASGF